MAKNDKSKIADIAKAVGVSPGTVSNALNNRKGVSEDKRLEILEVARNMGYERSFQRTGDKTIKFIQIKRHGEVVSDTFFFVEVMHGIEQQCRDAGYNLLMANINLSIVGIKEAKDYFAKETSQGLVVLATELRNSDLEILNSVSVPLVILDNYYRDTDYDCVLMNNEEGVFKAVSYLIECGHRRIGLLHSKAYINNFYYRRKSFFETLEDNGLSVLDEDVFSVSPTMEGAYKDMKKALEDVESLPTAFFAENDIIAFGAIRALKDHGYRLPDEVSIIGFDDLPYCETSSPRLSTICVDKIGIGALAVKRLIERMEGNCIAAPIVSSVRNKFVIRDSVVSIEPKTEVTPNDILKCI